MKQSILLTTFIFLSVGSVLAQQRPAAVHIETGPWINVAPANAGFTVLMPAKPSETVAEVKGRPGVENHLMTLETQLGAYVVAYVQFAEEVTDPDTIKLMLDRGREGGIASSQGKLQSEKEIKLNEYLGREWIVEIPGGALATARAYWVKRRLYQTIFVASPKAAAEPPEVTKLRQDIATKFLDSFTLSGDDAPK